MINIIARKDNEKKVATLIRGDCNSTLFRIKVPLSADGVEFENLRWQININAADGSSDVFIPAKVETLGGFISFDWTPAGTATKAIGMTKFEVQGIAENLQIVVWRSATYYIEIKKNVSATVSNEDAAALTEVQKLIIYVQTELPEVINARDSAREAAEVANKNAVSANEAAQKANASSLLAEETTRNAAEATEHANESTSAANTATQAAHAAAARAEAAADAIADAAPVIVCGAEGELIVLDDASDRPLHGLRVFGKTTQEGVPSPDNPVEMVNAGRPGEIEITLDGAENDAIQKIVLSTHGGLPGIPVDSGGNYTDGNGQQWVCDEIDLARGVYVKRVEQDVLDGSTNMSWQENRTTENTMLFNFENVFGVHIGLENRFCITNKFPSFYGWNPQSWGYGHGDVENIGFNPDASYCRFLYLRISRSRLVTQDVAGVRAWLADNPINIIYQLVEPAEIPLTDGEIAAYCALHTNKPDTTIINDAGAHMAVEYKADTKIYIDNKFSELAAAMIGNA